MGTRSFKSWMEENGRMARSLTIHKAHPQAHAKSLATFFKLAKPVRAGHIDRFHFQAVALCVAYQRVGLIEPHGLVIQNGSGESSQVTAFQKSAGIGKQRETCGVGFRKSI